MVACECGLNHSGIVLIRKGTVNVAGLVLGFPSMFMDNHGSFVARKKSFFIQLKQVCRLEVCNFGLYSLPVQTAF